MRRTKSISQSLMIAALVGGLLHSNPPRGWFIAIASAQSFTPLWKRVDADNGAAMAIDMNSITRLYWANGAVDAIVCMIDNDTCPPINLHRIRFDCRGHFSEELSSIQIMAPPNSRAGRLAEIACAKKKEESPLTTPFRACLQSKWQTGSPALTDPVVDGGKSVLPLVDRCRAQLEAWQGECVALGQGGTQECTSMSYFLAYRVMQAIRK